MRKVKRWRYYCDFCKKSGGSGGHIAKHEKHCTMNPNRICGMCAMFSFDTVPVAELVAILPDIESVEGVVASVEKAMPALREKTQNCPACILAALRQAKISVEMIRSFNFSEECGAWWAEFNEENLRERVPWTILRGD